MKILTILSLIIITALLISCQPTPVEESADDESLADDLAEIEALEDDLNLDELDQIDQELADLE